MSLKELLKNKKGHVDVGELLRLKRLERPDPAFWDRFEQQLAERSLRHAMGRGSRRDRLWTFFNAHWRLLASGTAAAASVALVVLGPLSGSLDRSGSSALAAIPPAPAPTQPLPVTQPTFKADPLKLADVDPAQAQFPVLTVSVEAPAEDPGFDLIAARTALRTESPETRFVPGLIASTKQIASNVPASTRAAFY